MKTVSDTHKALREKMARHFSMETLAQANKFGVDPKTCGIGTKKPITLNDLATIVQVAVRKALAAYQETLDEEGKEEAAVSGG